MIGGFDQFHFFTGCTPVETRRAVREAFEQAKTQASVRFESHVYPGTQHGFHNNSTPRYDAAAAQLSWDRTLAFFERHLKQRG